MHLVQNYITYPNGCIDNGSGAIYFNTNTDIGSDACTANKPCIRKTGNTWRTDGWIGSSTAGKALTASYTGEVQLNKVDTKNDVEIEAPFTYTEVSSGAPLAAGHANYVNADDCEAAATSAGVTITNKNLDASFRPSGCFKISAGYFYNVASTTHECDGGGGANEGASASKRLSDCHHYLLLRMLHVPIPKQDYGGRLFTCTSN